MPLLRSVGAWLMTRGISPGEPGWHFVPVLAVLIAPVTVMVFAMAGAYELVIRLPGGKRLDPRARWTLALLLVGCALVVVVLIVTGWVAG
jgi:hypothetical protein